ncbi:MAG: CDP-diacylglycerol--serine O-phosphatidyltransferase [Limisphaerales bacterium]|jgi:CDP-diacylglycerol--serine O-phosphatidyltransferase
MTEDPKSEDPKSEDPKSEDKEPRPADAIGDEDPSDSASPGWINEGDEDDTAGLSRRAKIRRRGIYLLPNLITSAALFAGFYAIVAGMNGNFISAALAMIVAMALDTADGRVARMTNTESAFGAQYDSLSDMVAFGVAPALVAFSWGLNTLGQVGWVVTFIFMACAALRLARFNTKSEGSSFTGLASPSAAVLIACCVWVWVDYDMGAPNIISAGLMAVITLLTALLMVSNFEYFSPKLLNLKGRVPFITLVFVVLGLSLLLLDPPLVLLFLFVTYALSGPVMFLWRKRNSQTQ